MIPKKEKGRHEKSLGLPSFFLESSQTSKYYGIIPFANPSIFFVGFYLINQILIISMSV